MPGSKDQRRGAIEPDVEFRTVAAPIWRHFNDRGLLGDGSPEPGRRLRDAPPPILQRYTHRRR